eukprot:jgi/Phyca11/552080/estExt2_Genewise1Plus.C_PHYCAscaffold_460130
MKLKLPDVKWTAAPLPKIHDMAVELMALNHFTQASRKRLLKSSGTTRTNRKSTSKKPTPHLVYSLEAIEDTPVNNHKPKKIHDNVVSGAKKPRSGFSLLFDYRGLNSSMTASDWINRCLYIETFARASEMVMGIAHHLRSQRSLKLDDMWLKAENERVQIFTSMKQRGLSSQVAMVAAQSVFLPVFFLTYMISPKTCQHFIAFVDEEAVNTYTYLLEDMEHGHLNEWCTMTAPLVGRRHFDLPDDAKVYDMIKCIRAEKASHKHASLEQKTVVNTFMSQH